MLENFPDVDADVDDDVDEFTSDVASLPDVGRWQLTLLSLKPCFKTLLGIVSTFLGLVSSFLGVISIFLGVISTFFVDLSTTLLDVSIVFDVSIVLDVSIVFGVFVNLSELLCPLYFLIKSSKLISSFGLKVSGLFFDSGDFKNDSE